MGKPWAKYESDWINHAKFRAINANAICLWAEGKAYADTNHTDGLLPEYEVKLWRFYSKKTVALLTRSAGEKSSEGAAVYAPLWDVHPLGWKMHDYLEHNDCREKVIARISKAEAEKARNKAKQQEWRNRGKRGT